MWDGGEILNCLQTRMARMDVRVRSNRVREIKTRNLDPREDPLDQEQSILGIFKNTKETFSHRAVHTSITKVRPSQHT